MSDISKYYFENFILILDRGSYLVEVHGPMNDPPRRHRVDDLPEWVFHSKLAIWLSQDDATIYERSVAGERIKKMFISARQRKNVTSAASLP